MVSYARAARPLRAAMLVSFSLVVSACTGTDSTDPLASRASFNHHNSPPSQPTSLATPEPVVTVSGSTVTVSWAAVARADEYQVVSSAAGIHTPKTSATSIAADVPNGEYTVKVRARTTATNNESGFSREVAFAVAVPASVVRDNTPPVITSAIAGTLGNNGWYTSDATVTWTVTDAESPLTSTGCEVTTVTSDTRGNTYTCSAASEGGSASASVTIKLDQNVPVISFAGVTAYTVDQTVGITCAATDGMSGLFASECPSATGAAYLFNIGSTVLSASAVDNAGNSDEAAASFSVSVTSGSMCNLVRRFVTHHGIANSLCVKLDAAAAAEARGNLKAEAGALNAFTLEIRAQAGKHIPAENAAILLRLVAYL